jgi:hypothetical protein
MILQGILVMGKPWPTLAARRAAYGGFRVVYALQVRHPSSAEGLAASPLHILLRTVDRPLMLLDILAMHISGELSVIACKTSVIWHGKVSTAVWGCVRDCLLLHVQASKLIMDHMAKEPFEIFWSPILALVMLLGLNRAAVVNSEILGWSFAVLMVACYLHYVISTINEICAFLGIRCLTIKPRRD